MIKKQIENGGQPALDGEDESLIQQCIEIIRREENGSVSLLQRRLRLGYTRAVRIMDELEQRGIVGPAKGAEPREVFVTPADGAPPADHGGRPQGSGEPPVASNREEFLNSNPDAKRLFGALLKEFGRRFEKFDDELKPMLRGFVDKAEQARQIGIVLIEFTDTLPGKKLTLDFYEQHKADFRDAGGKGVSFELLEWFIKVARNNPEPIADIKTALDCRQPLLLSAGEGFALESQRGEQHRHLPPDALSQIKSLFNDVPKLVAAFRADTNYFPNGRIREDLKAVLRLELEPKKREMDQFWAELV